LGALLFGEPRAPEIAVALGENSLAAPLLLPFELASVCLKKIVSHPERSGSIIDAFGLFPRLSIDLVEVDHMQTVVMARKTGLTTYDASYLWLAHELGGELISLDKQLLAVVTS
jgi:predicted nucleic acid-binding protein